MEVLLVAIGMLIMYAVLYFVGKAFSYPFRALNYYLNRWVWNSLRWGICKIRKVEFKSEWPPILVRMFQLILIGVIISFLASRIGRAMGVSNEANVFNAVGTLVTTVGFLLEFVSILAMLLPVLFVAIVPFLSVKDEYLGYKALARVPEFASTSDLIAALKTKSSKMREATADTLKKRGQAIVPELVEALQSGDEALSSLVIEILDAIDPNWKSNS